MRIAYILPSLARFAPNIVINSIISEVKKKHEVVVYYFDEKEDILHFDCPTIHISMDEIIDFDSYDIIHSNMFRPDKYVYKNRKYIKKAKLVTTVHQDIYKTLRSLYNVFVATLMTPIWLRYMSIFTAAVPISGVVKNLYIKRIPNLSDTIYNGVSVDYIPTNQEPLYAERIKDLQKRVSIVLGTYAQITYCKGIEQIIDIVNSRPELGAVIIGEGNAKSSLEDKVKKLGICDRIIFLPYLKTPYNYLENIDIYVMPSRSEGFGLAMVEAAFTQTPIICSDIAVFRELFDETQVAFFKLDDVISMSLAVDKIIASKDVYVNNSYNHALKFFSKESMSEQYVKLYEYLLG